MEWFDNILRKIGIVPESDLKKEIVDLKEELENYYLFTDVLEERLKDISEKSKEFKKEAEELNELCNLYLQDKENVDEKYKKVLSVIKDKVNFVEQFSKLSSLEKKIMFDCVPKRSNKTPENKFNYKRSHSDPKGFENFLDKISKCDYVEFIYPMGQNYERSKVTKFCNFYKENNVFVLDGIYVVGNKGKLVKVNTIAKTELQAVFVRDLLNSNL